MLNLVCLHAAVPGSIAGDSVSVAEQDPDVESTVWWTQEPGKSAASSM